MVQSKVAIRYAKSLLDLSIEQNAMDRAQDDMLTVAQAYDESRELQLLLQNPIIKVDKKLVILKLIFDGKLGSVSSAFIEIIAKKGREKLLGQIAHAFVTMAKERKNIFGAEVVSAVPLDVDSKSRIMDIISRIKPGTIELNEVVDPSVVGGFMLRIGDQMVDATVTTQIRELQREFSENSYISEL